MPYDTYVWGEEQAASGLTATAALGPTGYIASSGDANTIPKGKGGIPYLIALGSVSDTKPQGCAIIPQFSNRNVSIYGPGAINFAHDGWLDFRQPGLQPRRLKEGETLTGYLSNTNVNEGSLLAASIAYGGAPRPYQNVRVKELFPELITITSAAAVTSLSGAVALDSACTSTTWLDTEKRYIMTGIIPHISAATFGGIMHITNLGGPWAAFAPGIPMNPLSAVTFNAGNFIPFAEPIPFSGNALPSVSMTATSAGAITAGLVIGEL